MRFKKNDQQMLAEAYDEVSTPYYTKNLNTDRQVNQIGIILANRGYKQDETGRYDFTNNDGTTRIVPWQKKDGTGIGVIYQYSNDYPTYAGIVYMSGGLKSAKTQLSGNWNTIQDLESYYDVYGPKEAAEWLSNYG